MNALRLAVGTLTALPVRPPEQVDRDTARKAVLLAPIAVLPLGVAVTVVLWLSHHFDIDVIASGLLAVGVLVLGSRAFHVDGLADTADGLTASYDRERSLAVMKSGAVGPAGATALVVVLGLQAIGFADLANHAVAAGVLVCLSRVALVVTCMAGVPAADGDGLRAPFAGCVPKPVAIIYWIAATALGASAVAALGGPWRPVVAGFGVAAFVLMLVVHRATTRLGGVTGDIFGAAIELTLATLVVAVG